jgi:K(+)-stimulated pyrophosphate-energized sodium pump
MLNGINIVIAVLVPLIAIFGLIVCFALFFWVSKRDAGNDRMKEIAGYIDKGAKAFLKREYKFMAFVIVFLAVILGVFIHPITAILYVGGALFSVLAGYIGMNIAVKGNVRTAAAAEKKGQGGALKIAFRSGSVMGLAVASLGLLGVGLIIVILSNILSGGEPGAISVSTVITGFGLGASTMALFGRVGGGIYTKAADVGADLVGKVEAGIPEDDPRNPAVIADNVGDNVGDVAGMGSDLFESYVGSIISAVTLAYVLPTSGKLLFMDSFEIGSTTGVLFPLLLSAVGLIASIVGIFCVRGGKNPAASLNFGTYISSILVVIASLIMSPIFFKGSFGPALAIISGLIVGVAIGKITEIYTSADFKHVKHIAKQSETGEATTIISGMAVGMLSTVWPILFIAAGVFVANGFAGIYGIALAAVGMLSTTAMVVAVDAYGPVADNAGGIAEMSNLPHEVRTITDKLDSVGNTTAAIGKGFAIGSAALTALALFSSYAASVDLKIINIIDAQVVIGLFIGGMLPFLFSALTMNSVGKAANQMIEEVRRQFREDKGIMAGTSLPNYERCVDISTKAALFQMIAPGILAILAPIAVGLILGPTALGGLLAGALVTGVLLAIMMANAGGAWDNAKKHVEEGACGGKGSNAHKATVVGDTVGDPFKDTSGPSINILIKLMTIVSLVFAPLFMLLH